MSIMETPIAPREVMNTIGKAPIDRLCEYACRFYADSGLGDSFFDEDEELEAMEELETHCASCPLIWTTFINMNLPKKFEWLAYPQHTPPKPGRYLVKFRFNGDPNDEEDTMYWNGTDWRLYSTSTQSIGTVAAFSRFPKCPTSIN